MGCLHKLLFNISHVEIRIYYITRGEQGQGSYFNNIGMKEIPEITSFEKRKDESAFHYPKACRKNKKKKKRDATTKWINK